MTAIKYEDVEKMLPLSVIQIQENLHVLEENYYYFKQRCPHDPATFYLSQQLDEMSGLLQKLQQAQEYGFVME